MNSQIIRPSDEASKLAKIHQKWLQEYLQNLARQEKSPLTIQSYRSDLIHFLSWFEHCFGRSIATANASHIAQYQHYLKSPGEFQSEFKRASPSLFIVIFSFMRLLAGHKRLIRPSSLSLGGQSPLAPSTRKRRLTSLKKFFDYLGDIHRAKRERLFREHPVSNSLHHIKLKDADIEHTKLLCGNEVDTLAQNLTYPEDRLLCYLLFDGGLRIREAQRLKFSDFDWEKGVIDLIRKGGKRHQLQLRRKTRIFSELERVKTRQIRSTPFIFSDKTGLRPLSVRTLQGRIKKYLELTISDSTRSAHSFRKGCATELYQKTRDLLFVRDYLNHQNALVTQTYIENSSSTSHL